MLTGQVYVYLEALNAMVADRHDALSGQTNQLIAQDVERVLKLAESGKGHNPELMKDLLATRAQMKAPSDLGSVRGLMTDLRSRVTALSWRAEAGDSRARLEAGLVEGELRHVQVMFGEHSNDFAVLEKYEA